MAAQFFAMLDVGQNKTLAVVLKGFGVGTPLHYKKLLVSQRIFLWIIAVIFNVLDVKTGKLKIFINLIKRTTINIFHININNILMKNNYFLKQENQREGWHCFPFLQIPFTSGLIEDSWILISTSVVNLLQHYIGSFWKTVLYSHERMKMKRANKNLVLL